MRMGFQQSRETAMMLSIFTNMSIGQTVTYDALSKQLGFRVTAANSVTARRHAEKDHAVYIEIVPKVGFRRGTGSDAKNSGYGYMTKARRCAKKLENRMEFALSQNLSVEESREAGEMLSRSRIIFTTSQAHSIHTNRAKRDDVPLAAKIENFPAAKIRR